MNREFQQYRLAGIEGYRITRAGLQAQFKNRIISIDELENAVTQQLAVESTCAPWRTSEIERTGCREGSRLAALEFFWEQRQGRQYTWQNRQRE